MVLLVCEDADDVDDGSESFGQCWKVLLLLVAWSCSAVSRVYSLNERFSQCAQPGTQSVPY